MAYKPLDAKTAVDYLKGRAAVKDILPPNEEYIANELGDGNLNLLFIVTSRTNPEHTVVVKQALPYLRVAGDSWPLTLDRIVFETEALLLYNELVPGLVPRVYDHDYEMSLVVMENLRHHEVMRKALVRHKRFPKFAEHISTFMANTLFFTSDMYLSSIDKKQLQEKFINPHLRKLQEDFVFTNPFMDSPENNWNPLINDLAREVRSNAELKASIVRLKEAYMAHAQALIHSDLHTGSIMLNREDTRVIDPEFAFMGPIAFDVAALLENLILNYASQFVHIPNPDERRDYQEYLLDTIRETWDSFASKFSRLWIENNSGDLMPSKYWDFPGGDRAFTQFRHRYIQDLLRDMGGFGGVKMLRRMLGIVSVWDITSISDPTKRALAERFVISMGKRWILESPSINSVEDLIAIVREEGAKINA